MSFVQVIVGIVSLTDEDIDFISETEEITGEFYFGIRKFPPDAVTSEKILLKIKKLKKVKGVEITDVDKREMLEKQSSHFPPENDQTLKRIFY